VFFVEFWGLSETFSHSDALRQTFAWLVR